MKSLVTACIVILGLACGLPPMPSRAAAPVVSDAVQRERVDVTVYNSDVALVREVRRLDLPEGRFELEFRDVPARIDPVTLLVEGGGGLALLEQNYEFDLMSQDKILEKYVGREIAWIQEDGSRIRGTLLGMAAGPVYRVDEEVVFAVPGRLALPALPQNLRARPTLVWLVEAERSGHRTLETSYLTGGLQWSADYVLQLDAAGRRADLQAWVTVENRSGAAFADANLLLVAGDVNRVRQAPDKQMMMEMSVRAAAAPAFQEETLYDYHLYTLQRPTTLADQQIKQISLFEAKGVQIRKRYRLLGATPYFRGGGLPAGPQSVEVSYEFGNAQDNALGVPLPAGVFRVYGRSETGSRQLLGEDSIGHTPRDETVALTVGRAFDIVAERTRTDTRRVADDVVRSTFQIILRNHREEDVNVEVLESVGGFWEVTESTHPARKVSADRLAFDLAVPADGATTLTYTVQVTY